MSIMITNKPGTSGGGGSTLTFTNVSTTFTMTSITTTLLCTDSGSAYTITLPDPTTVSGIIFRLKKTTDSLTIITINPFAAETIDGKSSITLATFNEEWDIVSNGTNWIVLDHLSITPWRNNLTFSPQGFGTPTTNTILWRREGDAITIKGSFTAGTVSATIAGILLPTGIAINGTTLGSTYVNLGPGAWGDTSATQVSIYTANSAFIGFWDAATTNEVFITNKSASAIFTKLAGNNQWNSGAMLSFEFSFPVTNWTTT